MLEAAPNDVPNKLKEENPTPFFPYGLYFTKSGSAASENVCAMNASLPLFVVRLVVMMLMMQGVKSGAEALKDYQR